MNQGYTEITEAGIVVCLKKQSYIPPTAQAENDKREQTAVYVQPARVPCRQTRIARGLR